MRGDVYASLSHIRTRFLGFTESSMVMRRLIGAVILGSGIAHSTVGLTRPFTVADDIGVSHFVTPFEGRRGKRVAFSPDGRYFVAVTERGVLSMNTVEDTLWLFPVGAAKNVNEYARQLGKKLVRVSHRTGPVIEKVRWLPDSRGLAFLLPTETGKRRLVEVDMRTARVRSLSMPGQDVTAFDIRNGRILYSVLSPLISSRLRSTDTGTTTVGTGRSLGSLLFPTNRYPEMEDGSVNSLCELWTVRRGSHRRIDSKVTGQPILIHQLRIFSNNFWLSPGGGTALVIMPLRTVPKAWEALPTAADDFVPKIRTGDQALKPLDQSAVSQFVLIDLPSTRVTPLTDGPIGWQFGYYSAFPTGAWSADGNSIVVANVFVAPALTGVSPVGSYAAAPCLATVDVRTHAAACLESLPTRISELRERKIHRFDRVRFAGPDGKRVIVDVAVEQNAGGADSQLQAMSYVEDASRTWRREGPYREPTDPIDIEIHESPNEAPELRAIDRSTGAWRILMNPNPQLERIDAGTVSVYRWKDDAGREWTGGLVYPTDYARSVQYPLVLQTHGFDATKYLTYGAFPSAMAARELAAAGMVVLQIGGPANDNSIATPEEGAVEMAGYEAAIESLAGSEIIDPTRIGLIGFSRTVFGVMEALTKSPVHFTAAAISDGLNGGYFEYLQGDSDVAAHQVEMMMGGAPFGKGLLKWFENSPEFNLEKVNAPLRIETHGASSLLVDWEPYAILKRLHKPVDLILLSDFEHVLTNPSARLASQQGVVDWFSFWLKDREDTDPAKADQYMRWRKLREMQSANDAAKGRTQ